MSTADLTEELRFARDLAQEAGRLIMGVYATEFAVEDKAGGEGPVTEADRRANEHIVSQLRRRFPNDGIIAEESKDNSDARRFRRCWYIDPLDGTREFVARNGEFAVHVGLAIEGEACLGVVYKPADDKLYSGIVGAGGSVREAGRTRELHVSKISKPEEVRLLVSRSHKSQRTEFIRQRLGIQHVIECGSVGVKCGLLAEGRADLYIHPSPKSSRWDSCAPEAILRAAGGRFSDLHGDAYRYDGAELLNARGILAANPVVYELVLPAVRAALHEHPSR